ncbi:MAG: DUF4190 domain-containing protein [Clostridia bacterium]|nr:DUF4190 domain-containing protein [Clostridia bacterium]
MDEEEKKVEEEVVTTEKAESNAPVERKGFNVTALVLGIISVICFCWWYVAIPSGIIAIIFSIAGKNDAGRGMGVAGMVLGIIGLVLCIAIYILAILGIAAISSMA